MFVVIFLFISRVDNPCGFGEKEVYSLWNLCGFSFGFFLEDWDNADGYFSFGDLKNFYCITAASSFRMCTCGIYSESR